MLAIEFFLREVFPKLENVTLHVIAGKRHEAFWDLRGERIQVENIEELRYPTEFEPPDLPKAVPNTS